MSIKAIALELYRAQQKVGRLEKELDLAAPGEKDRIQAELQAAAVEMKMMRRMLDGAKVESPFAPSRHRTK
ncbi:MAG: hypothetical protein P4L42_05085 [Desulfocapsaceae bacterium]|nr:hypothetical protein [Desulfocapsaceae bacterium]